MKNKINPDNFFLKLENFNRKKRILILLILDLSVIFVSYLGSVFIKFNSFFLNEKDIIFLSLIIIIASFFYLLTGQYKSISRYTGSTAIYKLGIRNIVLFFIIYWINNIFLFTKIDLDLIILFWFITTCNMGFYRFAVRDILINMKRINYRLSKRVAIYGAGSAGVQLAAAILKDNKYKIITFIDDDPKKHKRLVFGIPIKPYKFLIKSRCDIEKILIAIPSLSPLKRKKIITNLQKLNIEALQVPSIEQLTNGEAVINNLKPINTNDLLGRDIALPNKDLLKQKITNSIVCVTGGGGTIGSELCNIILYLNPKKLVIIDNSENNLYKIDTNIKIINTEKIEIITILGDVNDQNLINNLFDKEKIDIVFHAAAYKHDPLVEENPIAGIYNNVFSTLNLCKASKKFNIKNFILISSDKAVRPSNVMGASKRLAELIVQSFASISKETIFSMVRFGNVLDSSGSVVPLFREQISRGGPVTITHKEIIRYFMTVTEAAQLVIQTCSMAQGGEVFLLKMGEPVKIYELAKQMIRLSGLTIKSDKNPNGDIKIVETGLRPGEKLYEELLIDAKAIDTDNPMIFKAVEESLDIDIILEMIESLRINLTQKNKKSSLKLLKKLVPSWKISND